MGDPGVVRIRRKQRLKNRRRPHVDGEVAALVRGPEQRQRMKCRPIDITGDIVRTGLRVLDVRRIRQEPRNRAPQAKAS